MPTACSLQSTAGTNCISVLNCHVKVVRPNVMTRLMSFINTETSACSLLLGMFFAKSAVWTVWSALRQSQQCGLYGPPCGKVSSVDCMVRQSQQCGLYGQAKSAVWTVCSGKVSSVDCMLRQSQQCGLYGPPCGKVSSVDCMVRLVTKSY